LSKDHESEYIIDANVLIDYFESDLQILTQVSDNLGLIHIARSTFNKVHHLTVAAAQKHHFTIVTPDLKTAVEASKGRGRLAYDDRETLFLAKNNGWICITNDKQLREECKNEGVSCIWGLELMLILVKKNIISINAAIKTGDIIRKNNPKYIKNNIISEFKRQIKLHKGK
jgi:rRNA-processing protein FCF1